MSVTNDSDDFDLDDLLSRLRARVDSRRASGEYPEGLEEQLDRHFNAIVRHRSDRYDFEGLQAKVAAVDDARSFSPGKISLESGLPAGAVLHKAVAKAVSRQTQGVIEQVQGFADAVSVLLREIVNALENPRTHIHAELSAQLDLVLDRLASIEAVPDDPSVAANELRRRVEILEAAQRRNEFRPWYSNARFEEAFRGTRDELLQRYRDLAQRLDGCDPVVDIGCGRGEFLTLLEEQGTEAVGIEIDPRLVHEATTAGLKVEFGEAVTWLQRQSDASLGGIVLIQVVEHLTAQETVEMVALAAEKLRPGGTAVVETVNPQSLYVYAHSFYLDPTHRTPVHPAYLHFLFQEAGFSKVDLEWRSPCPPGDRLSGDGPGTQADTDRLNELLFAPQDYAIIATR